MGISWPQSYVLNGIDKLLEQTARLYMELDYKPPKMFIKRRIKAYRICLPITKKSVIPGIRKQPFFSEFISGINLLPQGYDILISFDMRYKDWIQSRRIDGLIIGVYPKTIFEN